MRFTLSVGGWYGWTMFPGYFDCPYHSPIRVGAIAIVGGRQLDLEFLNVCYAPGVQNFRKRLRTLRRAGSHLVVEEVEEPDRTCVIVKLTPDWLKQHLAIQNAERFFDPLGKPDDRALLALAY